MALPPAMGSLRSSGAEGGSPLAEPLVHRGGSPRSRGLNCVRRRSPRRKRHVCFGYLPVWSEWLPLDPVTDRPDWPGVVVNVGSGLIMGLREALGGIVSASLVFSSSDIPEISAMLPWGISMTLYTMSFGVLWYAIFGRLQYGYATQQDLICILQAEMAAHIALHLHRSHQEHQIGATVVAVICLSAILSGACSVLTGKLGLGRYMLLFPTTVTNGFLGAIGVVVFRAALQTASGVKFNYFYPVDGDAFLSAGSLAQSGCMLGSVVCIRLGPLLLRRCFPKSTVVDRLGGLLCQLLPLAVFYSVVLALGLSMADLAGAGWTYPGQGSYGPRDFWTTYRLEDVHWPAVVHCLPYMPALVLMSIMCTMIGALAITEKFPTGPPGDPAPMEHLDFDTELSTVGASSLLLGLTGGNLNFHKFSVIQLRLDGGTHRVAVLVIALFAGGLFLWGVPIGQLIPKWFLAGLFMNTGIHFLKGTLLSYQSMSTFAWRGLQLPNPQYLIAPVCVVMAVFFSPAKAILTGFVLSVALFLATSSAASPVSGVVVGDRVVSRTKRPFWEMQVLRGEGHRILLLYLQGQLFFGSTSKLVTALAAASADEQVKYVILSMARVPHIDPSAARHLRTTSERLRQRGCQVIFCRMNRIVFETLTAAGVIKTPDGDLVGHLLNLRWKTVPMVDGKRVSRHASPAKSPPSPPTSPVRRSVADLGGARFVEPFRGHSPGEAGWKTTPPPPAGVDEMASPVPSLDGRRGPPPDAFCHETDALDHCDEEIVSEFCYEGEQLRSLEPYMRAYRGAVCGQGGLALPEWAFEDMNRLPRGLMKKLKPHCKIMAELPAWTKVSDSVDLQGSLCFVLKGALSVIQIVPLSDDPTQFGSEVAGFSFRQGKRLLKRYPPGHVAGRDSFFLSYSEQIIDPDLEPKITVSSKMGAPAEIWVLRPEAWAAMDVELKGPLTEMVCVQFADDAQHSRMQER